MNLKRLSQSASPLLGLLLFRVSLWAICNELREYNYRDVLRSLEEIPNYNLLLALVLTLLNYLILTGYDTLAVRYIRHPVSYRQTALTALISYGISNSIGFAL